MASLMVNCFLVVSYATPTLSAVIADTYLGRIRTITLSFGYVHLFVCIQAVVVCGAVGLAGYRVYILGVAILFITSLPRLLDRGAGLPGLIVAMVIISLGLGGIKSTLPPFLGE